MTEHSVVSVTLAAPQTLAEPDADLQVLDATEPLREAELDAVASRRSSAKFGNLANRKKQRSN
jgi:hypothetical protein